MFGLLKALVLVPIALLLVFLGVANRQSVPVRLDPFAEAAGGLSITIPLFVLIIGSIAVGVVFGYTAAWLAQGKNRKARRAFKRERDQLLSERDRLKNTLPATQAAVISRPA